MITETLLNSLKSLFSSLGAKTSDNNYAVGLFDKTSGEPKGMMGMSDLASVLGGKVLVYSGWMDASQSIDSLVTNKVGLYIVTNQSHTGDNDSLFFVGSETVTGLHTGSICRITLSISNGKLFVTSSDTTAALVSVFKLG